MTNSGFRRAAGVVGPVALGALMIALATGCDKGMKTGDVVGKVTIKGKAPNLEGLAINFMGVNGRPVTAPVAADGTYRASGVIEGSNKVGFAVGGGGEDPATKLKSLKPTGGEIHKDQEKALQKAQEDADKSTVKEIPKTFLDPNTSNLSANITAGQENTFNVDIK